jgi:Skp family chaperone for outer membrane proteins
VRHISSLTAAILAVAILSANPPCAFAQQGQEWFVPGAQQRSQGPRAPARPAPRQQQPQTAVPPTPSVPVPPPTAVAPQEPQQQAPLAQFQLPPEPSLPAVAKGSAPPAAVIGVLGVPDVMRACAAAQEIERVIGQRRQKLNEDAQKEQTAWRDLQQQLASQRSGLSPEQIRNKERELQERITNAQRQFRERNRVIQQAAQFALAQIERTLVAVIRQVAESRGMNLVLHRNQIALNVNEFDITDQVTAQLNKVLPAVVIPPDGQEPPTIPLAQGPAPQSGAAPSATAAGGGGPGGSASAGAAPATAKSGEAASQATGPQKP